MLKPFDHVTVAVTDPAATIGLFALPGVAVSDIDHLIARGTGGITVELAEWN